MKKIAFAVSALLLSVAGAAAADDPVAVRKALMQANAGAAGLSGAMLQGEMDYNPAVAKAAIATLHGTAEAYGDFFPEDSQEGGDTTAAPSIWEDPEGFEEALDQYRSDTGAAMEASGEDGPADLETFQEAVGPVLNNCRDCHEDFRVQDD